MALNYYENSSLTERQCMIDLGMPVPDTHKEEDEGYLNYTSTERFEAKLKNLDIKRHQMIISPMEIFLMKML